MTQWKSDGWYDAVLDIGVFRLLVIRETGDTVWFGADNGSTRLFGGYRSDLESAKQAALDTLIETVDKWKQRIEQARQELGSPPTVVRACAECRWIGHVSEVIQAGGNHELCPNCESPVFEVA